MGRCGELSLDKGLAAHLSAEGQMLAHYILQNKPAGKIAVLYQNG